MTARDQASIGWQGLVTVTVRELDPTTGLYLPKRVEQFRNIITDDGLDVLVEALRGSPNAQPEITWLALGDDNSTPVAGNTQLGAEQFRKVVTLQTAGPGAAEAETTVYIAPSEANTFTIREIGWFAGAASATPNSGVLVARTLWTYAKTALESIQIDRTDTLARL